MKIAILPGDGIGTEIVAQAVRVLQALDLKIETEQALVGGAAYEAHGHPLPDSTLKLAQAADAVLFGAVGDWKYDRTRSTASFTRAGGKWCSTSKGCRTSTARASAKSSGPIRRSADRGAV